MVIDISARDGFEFTFNSIDSVSEFSLNIQFICFWQEKVVKYNIIKKQSRM